eukprot:TRINITY_DN411_c0_g1_i2.p1 TRINITY_DN411_c0_g1~~TRINITY_DN411_c0_g1_i2.p1  ORF type:complete len:261 (+),score=65.69 TRINITY_DN411_c0_g1_i2:207-989(+)
MTATIKVTSVSLKATEKELKDFFSFSGDVVYVELKHSDDKLSQIAFVTFAEEKALDTAVLLTGAVIIDQPVTVEVATGYIPPSSASAAGAVASTAPGAVVPSDSSTAYNRAQNMMADLIAKGYVLGKDAAAKAKTFDEKHEVTKTTTSKVTELDKKLGISERLSAGAATVSTSWKQMDDKYQVTEKTKSAIGVAGKNINEASAAMMKNKYVASGSAWLSGAFGKVVQAATDVHQIAKEKINKAEGSGPHPGATNAEKSAT